MGWGLGALTALNPVAVLANAFSGGMDFWAANEDRQAAEANARRANELSSRQFDSNVALQREFAKNGIRWKVEDAQAAGLHPLAALGNMPQGFSPSQSVFSSGDPGRGDSFRALGRMGQDVSRAVMARQTEDERALNALMLEKVKAEIDMIHSQALESKARARQIGLPPPTPSKYQTVKLPDGTSESVYSSDYSQAIMSDPVGMWANSFKKAFGSPDTRPFYNFLGKRTKRLMLHPWRD